MHSTIGLTTNLLAQTDNKQKKLAGVELEEVSKHVNDGIQHNVPWELLLDD